jgi:hypothetical protein
MEIPRDRRSSMYWIDVGDGNVHRSYAVGEGVRLVVGSAKASDIVLMDRMVSARHWLEKRDLRWGGSGGLCAFG